MATNDTTCPFMTYRDLLRKLGSYAGYLIFPACCIRKQEKIVKTADLVLNFVNLINTQLDTVTFTRNAALWQRHSLTKASSLFERLLRSISSSYTRIVSVCSTHDKCQYEQQRPWQRTSLWATITNRISARASAA